MNIIVKKGIAAAHYSHPRDLTVGRTVSSCWKNDPRLIKKSDISQAKG